MRIFFHYIVDEHSMYFCSADLFEVYMGNNPLPEYIKPRWNIKKEDVK